MACATPYHHGKIAEHHPNVDLMEPMQMPIFRRSNDDETYNEKALREARRQRERSGREVEKENRRTGGRGTAAERRPDARDEEDIQHLRGWLMGGGKGDPKNVVNKPTAKDRTQARKNDRERDRQDAARAKTEARRAAQQSGRQARQALEATNKNINKTKNENIKGYTDKGKGRKIENERARLNKKYGQGSKQAKNFDKKNPPPAPKKKGFWS